MCEAPYRLAAPRRVAPGSRLARAYQHGAQNQRRGARLAGTREGRPETRLFARSAGTGRVAAIFLFTMSNSAVFFVPAARCCARVLLFLCSIHPMRGERSAERRGIPVVARFGARRAVPGEARRASSGTRLPLGAPPWRWCRLLRRQRLGLSTRR